MEYPGENSPLHAGPAQHKYRNTHVVYLRITNRSSILWTMSLFSTDIDGGREAHPKERLALSILFI